MPPEHAADDDLDLDEMDLEHKMIVIGTFINEIKEDNYTSEAVKVNLAGVLDVLEEIRSEMEKIDTEYEYQQTWMFYTLGWLTYNSTVNMDSIRANMKKLENRFDMLIRLLPISKNKDKRDTESCDVEENDQDLDNDVKPMLLEYSEKVE